MYMRAANKDFVCTNECCYLMLTIHMLSIMLTVSLTRPYKDKRFHLPDDVFQPEYYLLILDFNITRN